MSAEDKRELLEYLLWQEVKDPGLVGRILAASDAVVKAAAREAVRKPKPEPAGPKPLAVHFTLPGDFRGRTACRRCDWTSARWQATSDPQAVTCQSCRARPEWQEATRPRPALALATEAAPPAPPDDRVAITPDGDLKPVSGFKPGEKWWCDGEDCSADLGYPHVHDGWGAGTLAVDLLTGWDERHPGYVKRDGSETRPGVPG